MYVARQLTGATLQKIGCVFGNRHHTTALHCIRKIEKLRCSDDAVDRAITQVMNAVGLRVV
jgi:chromosomal replication initiator protein